MDLIERRELLVGEPNVHGRLDFVSTLEGLLDLNGPFATSHMVRLSLRYVPDRVTLSPDSLANYLRAMGSLNWPTLENAAATIIEDINDQLVPRWLQLHMSLGKVPGGGLEGHSVLLEDRQPGWSNPQLLSRLKLL